MSSQGDYIAQQASAYDVSEDTVAALYAALRRSGGVSASFDIDELGGKGRWTRRSIDLGSDDPQLAERVNQLCQALADRIRSDTPANPSPIKTIPIYMPGSFRPHTWWPSDKGAPTLSGQAGPVHYAYFAGDDRLLIMQRSTIRTFDASGYDIQNITGSKTSSWRGLLVHLETGALVITALPEITDEPQQADDPSSSQPPDTSATPPADPDDASTDTDS
jgi:hypothetical protein